MRRILFAVLIWVVLVGGLSVYMQRRDANPVERSAGRAAVVSQADYVLEVTPAFAPVPDPFALDLDGEKPAALTARFRGREVLRRETGVEAGVPIEGVALPGVVEGWNEVLLSASPAAEGAPRRRFLQARVLRNGVPVASDTFWADGFARVDGVLNFVAPKDDASERGTGDDE